MRTTFVSTDVCLLLKDITGLVEPESTEIREKKIQSGTHYCEMLPIEYEPTKEYMEVFNEMLQLYSKEVAKAVSVLSEKIYLLNKKPVLISLARAGIPTGILVKHYLKRRYGIDAPHYGISIIRGKGIDKNAINYILEKYDGSNFVFIDGWTGKGAIKNQLDEALKEFDTIKSNLAVIADPAGVADIYGTKDDLMIPSACLNSTVTGLISRTFLRSDIIGENDFHGALFYGNMVDYDKTYVFIDLVENYFDFNVVLEKDDDRPKGIDDVLYIKEKYNVKDINFVKPGIGEATRVLLRRVPDLVIINEKYKDNEDLKPILRLAQEKQVEVCYDTLKAYKVCGIIRNMADT